LISKFLTSVIDNNLTFPFWQERVPLLDTKLFL